MLKLISKIFVKMMGGSRNDRIIRSRMRAVVEQVNPLEEKTRALSDEALRQASLNLRERRAAGENRRAILPEAFALVREASRRARDHRQFDVQLVAGMVLDEGWIAEEATGEGKTVACYPAIYMAWLDGMKSHVITVNDYLVERDATFAEPVFAMLGVSVGYITNTMPCYGPEAAARKAAYACDVTYGTNSEFGFDYLRDNMKLSTEEQVQGRLDFAIIDEVDSILIDEARTPLIISGPAFGDPARYKKADSVTRELIRRHQPYATIEKKVDSLNREIKTLLGEIDKTKDAEKAGKLKSRLEQANRDQAEAEAELATHTAYYEVELDRKSAHMTHEGVGAAQEISGVGSFYVGANMEWPHLMEQSLRAHLCYERDKEYIVRNDEVVIVDEFTGRIMEGRQWSDGLHQAVEAKEGVRIKEETQTLATITLQNYFKLYKKLAGMTGTAMTEAEEFMKIYKLDVAAVPTHKPMVRDDQEDLIFIDEDGKFKAIVEEINTVSKEGRPILVGTTSIEKSERLSEMLMKTYGIEHELLNGRPENVARESEIVAKAGQQHPLKKGSDHMVGNVTIATNMAGRGTDIKLAPEAKAAGGLHIVGTERHEARRVDNQLRGRSGRQGDPGSSRFYLSLRDELLSLFAGDWTIRMLSRLGMQDDQAIESKMVSKGIERAQKKVEQRNFEIRKNLLEYDEIMDVQRKSFYSQRQAILEGHGLDGLVEDMIDETLYDACDSYLDGQYAKRCIAELAGRLLHAPVREDQIRASSPDDMPDLELHLRSIAKNDAEHTISMTTGEYVFEDADPRDWDLKGLCNWVMREYGLSLSQNQLRKMPSREIEEMILQAACEHIDKLDLSTIQPLLDESYARAGLADWANAKFGFSLTTEELSDDPEASRDFLKEKVLQAYRRRQVEYPVEFAIERTIGQVENDTENVYALDALASWANGKFDANLSVDDLQGKTLGDVVKMLVALSETWLEGGELEKAVEAALGKSPNAQKAAEFCAERFGTSLDEAEFQADPTGRTIEVGRKFLTRELSELQRYVLLQIYDATWKDHLLNMDHLKGAIGLRGYAEQDPKVAYKREGARLFDDMFASIREKVTDMIFKVRLTADAAEMQNVYQVSQQVHEQLQGYDHLAAQMTDSTQHAGEVQSQKVQTIVRETVRVGRNDPCPCGSGKKYKKCCGQNA